MSKKPLFLLDGYSLIYRTYFAFIRKPLINTKGMNVSVLYGFFNTLFSFFEKYNPEYFAVVLDPIGPTFRHDMYQEYKANREKAPDDLHAQTPIVEEILEALKIQIVRRDKYEADDIIFTLAKKCEEESRKCYVLSSDKDLMQFVSENIKMLISNPSGYEEIGVDGVVEKLGVRPEQVVDYLALIGDTADNVPGVKGVGPKTAARLLQEYGDLDEVYNNVEKQTKSLSENLARDKELAYLSKTLVQLAKVEDLPAIDELAIKGFDKTGAGHIFAEHEIKKFATSAAGEEKGKTGDLAKEDMFSFIPGSVKTVLNEKDLDKMLALLQKEKVIAFDIETDNADEMQASPIGFAFAVNNNEGFYLPIRAKDTDCLAEDFVKAKLKELFANKDLKVIGQNIKYDYKVAKRWGLEIEPYFDTMLAAWLLDSQFGKYGLDRLAEDYLNYNTIEYKDIVPKKQTLLDLDLETVANYAGEDAYITYSLFRFLDDKLKNDGITYLLFNMEMPLLKILAEAEMRGIKIDSAMLGFYEKKLQAELDSIEKEVFQIYGEKFNIRSPKQLQVVLFEDLKLPATKKIKTGYSTDTSVLTELAYLHPIPKLLLEHRALAKLISTYVNALPKLVNSETLRIHTNYVQTGTATGRLSSRDPNLQNIPIKTEQGRLVRNAFVSKKGSVFVSADYSQIELVLLAHLSKDEDLMSAFKRGEDIHAQTASFLFNVDISGVSPQQRSVAKTINFGVIYGMSSYRLSRELEIPMSTANTFIESYYKRFTSLEKFIAKTVDFAEKNEYVETLLGHRRPIIGINSKNKTEKKGAERVALNTVIQGSGADIIKVAMLKSQELIERENIKADFLLQIHDELLFEVEENCVDEFVEKLRATMEGVITLDVPLRVSIETGKSWGELN